MSHHPPSSSLFATKTKRVLYDLMCLKHLKNNNLYGLYTVSAIVWILHPAPEFTVGEGNKLQGAKKETKWTNNKREWGRCRRTTVSAGSFHSLTMFIQIKKRIQVTGHNLDKKMCCLAWQTRSAGQADSAAGHLQERVVPVIQTPYRTSHCGLIRNNLHHL